MVGRSRWAWAVGAATVAAVTAAVVGVSSSGGHVAAADSGTATPDVVTVSGVGVVQGVPDTLTATFDVHVTRHAVQDALDAEASSAGRVLRALKHDGVSGRDVQTASLQLSQHYDNNGHVSGYDATETVTARVHDLHSAGHVISDAAAASGNDVGVDGLSFDIADDHALVVDARAKAFADAKDHAQQYAGLAGRSLGSVQRVTETVAVQQPEPQRYADGLAATAGGAAKPIPIRPGEQPVSVTVTITWRLS